MRQKSFWKWLLQALLPVVLFATYGATQVEPFISEHQVARIFILVVIYSTWHFYIEFVRDGKL